MTQEQLDYWSARPDVIKVEGHNAINLHDEGLKVIVTIFWSHSGIFPMYSNRDERFTINVSKDDSYPETRENLKKYLLNIHRYKYIMVNHHEPNYTILFSVELNPDDRIFVLKIKEYPLLGKMIISEDEEKGIQVKL